MTSLATDETHQLPARDITAVTAAIASDVTDPPRPL